MCGQEGMASSYGQPAHLFCGSLRLLSHTGVQQGDNMGPAGVLFCHTGRLGVLLRPGGVLWQAWYMDHVTIVEKMEALSQVVQAIQSQGPERGLTLNKAKCVLWGPGASEDSIAHHPALQGILVVPFRPGSGLRVLGVPVEHPRRPEPSPGPSSGRQSHAWRQCAHV